MTDNAQRALEGGESGHTPYPQPPELGWYPQDAQWLAVNHLDDQGKPLDVSVRPERTNGQGTSSPQPAVPAPGPLQPQALGQPAEPSRSAVRTPSPVDKQAQETVLSGQMAPVFGNAPRPPLRLTKQGMNGQHIDVMGDSVLGRKPSPSRYMGLAVLVLVDSSRTISREHAMIRFDTSGRAWVEDLGSLNGTSIILDSREIPVTKEAPRPLVPGAVLRLGDEFYNVSALGPTR